MKLAFADPRNMTISPLNMNYGRPKPDISGILPSVRQRGVLLTMLVLEKVENGVVVPNHFEVVAGACRWYAAMQVIAEGGEIDPVPIGILEAGDDAAAIEASLIENLARLPPDEVTRWETFAKLLRKGRTPEQIAATFGMSDAAVRRTLALGDLLPRIRALYRREEINVTTVRCLTLATKAQQKAWLALHDDPDQYTPIGPGLKAWLFGGASIPTKVALFPLDDYPGQIVADLFGEDSYFSEPDLFWTHQNQAVADKAEALRADGWTAVEVMEIGETFQSYKHVRTRKEDGGKVFISVSPRGEVTIDAGWLTGKEARRALAAAAKAEGGKPAASERAEVTSAQQTYIDLHRHAAVRTVLADHPSVALRLLVAHAVAGSPLWTVEPDPQRAGSAAMAESVKACPAQARFAAQQAAALRLLGIEAGGGDLVGRRFDGGAAAIFAKLLSLSDAEVLTVAAVVMAETLAAGGTEVEAAGTYLNIDMGAFWSPDAAFFDLIRDREAINAMLKEVGGKRVADGNVSEKVRTQKAILRDFLEGANNRPKVEAWTPRWLTFPAAAYTSRPFATAAQSKAVARLLRRVRAPAAPATVPAGTLVSDPNPALLAAE